MLNCLSNDYLNLPNIPQILVFLISVTMVLAGQANIDFSGNNNLFPYKNDMQNCIFQLS